MFLIEEIGYDIYISVFILKGAETVAPVYPGYNARGLKPS